MTPEERAALDAHLAKAVWEAAVARNQLDLVIAAGTAGRLALAAITSPAPPPVPALPRRFPLFFPITLTEVPA